jgi:two-component system, cell cycle sensor histidine kinase and response regulator CckA
MKLQHKAWGLVLATVGLLTLIAAGVSERSISSTFSTMELERAALEGERARRLLDLQMDGFVATLKDYAYWADTVQFAEGENRGFIEENFTTDNMNSLRISGVAVFSRAGEEVGNLRLFDRETLGSMSQDHLSLVRGLAQSVLDDASGDTVLRTYRSEQGQLLLIAIAAIRPDAKTGTAPRGALAMVRRLDQRELIDFSRVLMTPVTLSYLSPTHMPGPTHFMVLGDAKAEEHAVIRDHRGQPVAELILSLDRDLHQEGHVLARAAGYAVALTGLLLGALLVLLLDRLLLRRLQRIHTDLQSITDEGASGEGSVRVVGNDELSALAVALNRLLLRVRSDVAEQKALHERQEALQMQLMQSQKTEALGRFTSGIAHDFNNSLAAIGGWMRLADEDLANDHPAHEALQQGLKATRYANGLMRQLLAFSRQSKPQLQTLKLSQLIDESRSLVASGLLKTCDLQVTYPSEDLWVQADLTQMQQVIVNLLLNASDAMGGQGKIWLSVSLRTFPLGEGEETPGGVVGLAPGIYACITVRDEGPGIAPEHLSRIFDPFFTTKTVGKGTGLGLSVAHGIMARHGGAIGVSSVEGEGTSMHLYLPRCEPPVAAQETGRSGPSTLDMAPHILFVDDDQLVRHAWGALLERQGWAVTRARDGEEAWRLFQQSEHRWSMVLTDLAMPKLDGIGLAQRIRATSAPPPIVLMSGNVSLEDAEHLMETDFVAVLHKPVDAEQLNKVLNQVLQGSKSPD